MLRTALMLPSLVVQNIATAGCGRKDLRGGMKRLWNLASAEIAEIASPLVCKLDLRKCMPAELHGQAIQSRTT